MRAVDVEGDEIVAAYPGAPGRIDLRDHAALELEGGIGGVVGVGLVGLAGLVDTAGNMRRAEAAHGLHLAEEVVEHVAPVAEHIEDDAAAILLAVVPARALRGLPVALEHPVAELAAHREHAAEEAAVAQHLDLAQAGEGQLVLHHAAACAPRLGELDELQRALEIVRDRLFAVDVLARLDGAGDEAGPHLGGAGIEEQRVVLVGERRVQIRGLAGDAVLLADFGELFGVAAHDDRVRDHLVAIGKRDAALVAHGADGADEVLVVSHAAGDAVHDDAEPMLRHSRLPPALAGWSTSSRGDRSRPLVTVWLLTRCTAGVKSSTRLEGEQPCEPGIVDAEDRRIENPSRTSSKSRAL